MSSAAGADYSAIYDPDTDFDARYTMATVRRIAERVAPGDRVLELGLRHRPDDRAPGRPGRARHRRRPLGRLPRPRPRPPGRPRDVHPRRASPSRAGRPSTGDGFDHVLLCNLIHELPDPVDAAGAAPPRCWRPSGLVHLSLQNPDSIHRLVAVEMGLIDDVREVSDRGDRFGTLGLWGADDLARLAREAGLGVVGREGVMLKPLPNGMMAELPPEVLDGFERAARHLPAHCAMNLLVLAVAECVNPPAEAAPLYPGTATALRAVGRRA